MIKEQRYAFTVGRDDGRRHHLDGWANHSPSYRAGQVMARVERDLSQGASPTPSNDTLQGRGEVERYLSDRFEWAAPGDQQEDVWLVRFCDNDVRDAIYTGPDAESEAWAAWNRHAPGYNMFVFRLAALQKDTRHGG